jgi:hypothetical protein
VSISDILFESRHQFRLRTFGSKRRIDPEEDEYCESPGRSGCGCCPGCEAWADEEYERKRDREMEER